MKVLVTGASGFIGSHLVGKLCQSGHDVRALVRKTSNLKFLRDYPCEKVVGSLGDIESLTRAAEGVDLIYHLAGQIEAKSEIEFIRTNTEGTKNLVQSAKKSANLKRFVFVSSLAAGGPMESYGLRKEEDADYPVSAYGRSKKLAEEILLHFKSKIPISIIRPPIVYGPRDLGILKMVEVCKNRYVPILVGKNESGQKYYSSIYVEDLCEGIKLAGEADYSSAEPEIFYLSGDDVLSFEEMLDAICLVLGSNPKKIRVPEIALRFLRKVLSFVGSVPLGRGQRISSDKLNELIVDYWLCSNEKAKALLGFQPQFGFKEAIKTTVDWYRAEGWI